MTWKARDSVYLLHRCVTRVVAAAGEALSMERLAQSFGHAKENVAATQWAALAAGVWTRLGRVGDRLRVYRLLEALQMYVRVTLCACCELAHPCGCSRERDEASALRTRALMDQITIESVDVSTIDARAIAAFVALDAMTTRLHRAAAEELPIVRYALPHAPCCVGVMVTLGRCVADSKGPCQACPNFAYSSRPWTKR